jgi:UDP-N-acetylglucosamine 2-epimerase (non-hydrolysing)
MTLHRPSNVDVPETFARIFRALETITEKLPVVFPVHPRTRKTIADLGLSDRVAANEEPARCRSAWLSRFSRALQQSRLVLTDSGGIQEETTALGIPCLTLRENTERPITVELGTNVVVGTDTAKIVNAASAALNGSGPKAVTQPPLWDGHTSERILNVLEEVSPKNPDRWARCEKSNARFAER